jgi:hypothetical protein
LFLLLDPALLFRVFVWDAMAPHGTVNLFHGRTCARHF